MGADRVSDGFAIDAREVLEAGRQLDGAFSAVSDAYLEGAVEDLADVAQVSIRAAARRHRATGHLERNVRKVADRPAGASSSATVRATGMIAPIIVKGSAAHVIRPIHAHALDLSGSSRRLAASARHPGTRADPFVARGIETMSGDVERVAERTVEKVAGRLAAELEEG